MARPLRVEYEGAFYHILSRGNRAEFIFAEDKDKEYFLRILQRVVEKYGIELYAYCIMGNHYHLLMGTPHGTLSKVMHIVQSSYGSYQQRERGWIGHVFAGRYKSLCVEKEGYLLELSRYIHLNPVRAKIVKEPEEYLWSSYRFYVGKDKRPKWLNTDWLLEEYGKTYTAAQREYRKFVQAGIGTLSSFPAGQVAGQAILGSKDFVEKVTSEIGQEKQFGDVTAKKLYRGQIGLEDLHRAVCRFYGVEGLTKGKRGGRSRDMFVYLSKTKTSATNGEIGEMAGKISFSAVSKQYLSRLRKLKENSWGMKEWDEEAAMLMSKVKG
ncbi:MAG: transposase [Nitrospirota bacterium]